MIFGCCEQADSDLNREQAIPASKSRRKRRGFAYFYDKIDFQDLFSENDERERTMIFREDDKTRGSVSQGVNNTFVNMQLTDTLTMKGVGYDSTSVTFDNYHLQP